MATGAGRPRAACRGWKATGAASRLCAGPCARRADLGISVLTIFSFSSENWSRPPSEIRDLMGLLRRFIRNDLADLHKSNVRVRIIGERDGLDRDICLLLQEAEDLTRGNDGLTLVVAFNYGARQEIAQRRAAARDRGGGRAAFGRRR